MVEIIAGGCDERRVGVRPRVEGGRLFPLTQGVTFHLLMTRVDLRPLRCREQLIREVKGFIVRKARNLNLSGLSADCVSSEAITRTWRKMVEEGYIERDGRSADLEQKYRQDFGV